MQLYQADKVKKTLFEAAEKLKSDISFLNLARLKISDYNRDALNHFINNRSYYLSLYISLLDKALRKLNKPVSDSTFIDYGGGCGFLSILAKNSGFGNVIYNDINCQSVSDSEEIACALGTKIDFRIEGNIDRLLTWIHKNNHQYDLICSFDVIEHIYNIEEWISKIATLDGNFALFFMTSANPCNPFISKRLKKLHLKSENIGYEKNARTPDGFLNTSFLQERKNILLARFPEIGETDLSLIAKGTRGLIKERIELLAEIYFKTGEIKYFPDHPTNTCDPYTGSWTERLIDLNELKDFTRSVNLKIRCVNTYYSYNNNHLINLIKMFLNILIFFSGKENLFFSPSVIVEIDK